MQVRCVWCWEMYSDQTSHLCRPREQLDPVEICSPAEPPASSEKNRLTLTLYTSDAIKLRDCLRHMDKLVTLIGMPSSVFFDTLKGVETSLTNALVQNGTPQSTESLLKKKATMSPPLPAITSNLLIQAGAWAVLFLAELPHPYSLDELASKLHQLYRQYLTFDQCYQIARSTLLLPTPKGALRWTGTPSDKTG